MINQPPNYSQSIFIDETALTAFMDPDQPYYLKARSLFLDLDDMERHMVTTNYIMLDTHQWLKKYHDYEKAEFFLNTIEKAHHQGVLHMIPGSQELEHDAKQLLIEHPEYQLSFGEAITSVVMLNYGIRKIFTFNPSHAWLTQFDPQIKKIPSSY